MNIGPRRGLRLQPFPNQGVPRKGIPTFFTTGSLAAAYSEILPHAFQECGGVRHLLVAGRPLTGDFSPLAADVQWLAVAGRPLTVDF